jgi:hypothetical protein
MLCGSVYNKSHSFPCTRSVRLKAGQMRNTMNGQVLELRQNTNKGQFLQCRKRTNVKNSMYLILGDLEGVLCIKIIKLFVFTN